MHLKILAICWIEPFLNCPLNNSFFPKLILFINGSVVDVRKGQFYSIYDEKIDRMVIWEQVRKNKKGFRRVSVLLVLSQWNVWKGKVIWIPFVMEEKIGRIVVYGAYLPPPLQAGLRIRSVIYRIRIQPLRTIRIQTPLSWKLSIYFLMIINKKLLPFSFFEGVFFS